MRARDHDNFVVAFAN